MNNATRAIGGAISGIMAMIGFLLIFELFRNIFLELAGRASNESNIVLGVLLFIVAGAIFHKVLTD